MESIDMESAEITDSAFQHGVLDSQASVDSPTMSQLDDSLSATDSSTSSVVTSVLNIKKELPVKRRAASYLQLNSDSDSDDGSIEVLKPPKAKAMAKTANKGAEKKIPDVVAECYEDFSVNGMINRAATCQQCKATISSGINNSSNWVRHLNLPGHEKLAEKYEAFKRTQKQKGEAGASHTRDIASFFKPVVHKWKAGDREQKEMRKAWTKAIISCSLPLSIVEHRDFRAAIELSQPRFSHMDRRSVSAEVQSQFGEIQLKLRENLRAAEDVSVTVDIWSDRKLRSFLGVTVHYLHGSTLRSDLLCCLRMKGSHTGINIRCEFKRICLEYEIGHKIAYIVSDNASNMRKAFEVHFSTSASTTEESDDEDAPTVDNRECWSDLEVPGDLGVSGKHIRCFAHSLQLAVKDGLKHIKSLTLLGRCSKISSLLHTSTTFKDAFEGEFGEGRSIPQPVDTRWNSMYTHLLSISGLDQTKLNRALDAAKASHCKLGIREYQQLADIIALLKPFYEVTQRTQGEKQVTISTVLPSVLAVHKTVSKAKPQLLNNFKAKLLAAMETRFKGILVLVDPNQAVDEKLPFGNRLYLMSAVLDQNWGIRYLSHILEKTTDVAALRQRVKDMLMEEVSDEEFIEHVTRTPQEVVASQVDASSIFSDFYNKPQHTLEVSQSAEFEISSLLATQGLIRNANPIQVWQEETGMRQLRRLALKLLSAPATSAPVERVFSVGGHILSPRRSCLSAEMLSQLMVIKCCSF